MTLDELKARYQAGAIAKPDYIDAMNALHRSLHDYAAFMKGTAVERIEIAEGRVVMTMRETGVKLICARDDKRIAPIEALNFGTYEKAELDMACALIGPGETFIDVGANVGFYTLTLARRVPDLRIFAFEPIPTTFEMLREHVALNGVANARIFPFGFSDREETRTFYLQPDNSVNASAANLTGAANVREVSCHVRRLDDFVRETGVVMDFVKCDVEGAELLVFRGGLESIRTQRPVIFAEMLRKWSAKFGYHPNEILNLLGGVGYHCFTAKGGRLQRFTSMDESTVETNFFFLHGERHAAKIRALA